MVYGFKLVREAVSQGLLMSWAVLVFRIHPALTVGAVRPAGIGADITCLVPFAHYHEWVIENGELVGFVVARYECTWGGPFI